MNKEEFQKLAEKNSGIITKNEKCRTQPISP